MALDRARTARGALAGSPPPAAWSAQSRLDRRVFGVDYLDEALLGKAVTRGPAWPVAGVALHLANGAAVRRRLRERRPAGSPPSGARGPVAGLAEHLATWPLTVAVGRAHPARDEFPASGATPRLRAGDLAPRAVRRGAGRAQRRLNAEDNVVPPYEHVVSSNGHGNIEHAVGVRNLAGWTRGSSPRTVPE